MLDKPEIVLSCGSARSQFRAPRFGEYDRADRRDPVGCEHATAGLVSRPVDSRPPPLLERPHLVGRELPEPADRHHWPADDATRAGSRAGTALAEAAAAVGSRP